MTEKLKPQRISLDLLIPIEFLVPEDKLEEIAEHYDGTVDSIKAGIVYSYGDKYLLTDGNKRAVFLKSHSHDEFNCYLQEDDPDEVVSLILLAEKAKDIADVSSITDLVKRVVPRDEYELIMGICDSY